MRQKAQIYTQSARKAMTALCVLILSCTALHAQDLQHSLSSDSILLGDQVEWQWTLSVPEGYKATRLPAFPDSIYMVDILSKKPVDTLNEAGITRYSQELVITVFDSAVAKLPQLQAAIIRIGDDHVINLMTADSLSLYSTYVDVDTTKDFKPVKDIIDEEQPGLVDRIRQSINDDPYFYIILAIMAVLLCIVTLLSAYYIRRYYYRKIISSLFISPEDKAQKRMDKLEKAQLWARQEYKQYYSELSHIIKDYLLEQKGFKTQELTTTEILRKIKKNKELKSIHGALREILTTADMAKFAKSTPGEAAHMDAVRQAQHVIRSLIPIKDDTQKQTHA